MNKYLYKIKDLEMTPWLKYWFVRKSKINFDLSEILNGTSFDLTNTVNKKLHLIDIFGNSKQETTTGKNLLNSYLSNRTTQGVTLTYDENTQEITLNGTCDRNNTVVSFTKSNSLNLQSGKSLYALIKYISGSSNGYLALRAYNSNYSRGVNLVTTEPLTDDIFTDTFYNEDVIFNYFSLRFDNGSTFDNLKIKVMFSTVDAVYEPYTNGASPNPDYPQEIKSSGDNGSIVEKITNSDNTQLQIYTIPCQQPMRAIGDVKDTFIKVNGVWYERHNIGEFIANDNLLGNGETENTINLTTPTLPIEANILPNSLSLKVKSNILQSTINNYSGFNGTTGANRIRIALSKSFALTSEEAKTFLYQKGLKIIYVTTEPLDLPCTQAQITALENLQKAKTYKDVTHIYSEDEVPAELEIQYYKEKGE